MTARLTIVAGISSAAVGALITAAVFLFVLSDDPPSVGPGVEGSANIAAGRHELVAVIESEPPEAIEAEDASDFVRGAVDWSAVYAESAPSLVSVATSVGAGSGFFVSEDGHVITNLHVVNGARWIRIMLNDGQTFASELVARDAGNDLALLKVDPGDVEIVVPAFGSLEDLRIGDPVGALGAPFGLPNSLTVGVVSGLGRLRPSGNRTFEPLRNMIQTDAALNPGNSGGMLVDAQGRVVGIPTQIESPDRVSSGIGFAVPSDTLLEVLPTLMRGEDVRRSFLGVRMTTDDGRLVVSAVACDSAADEAGIRDGDVLTGIDGEVVESFDDVFASLGEIAPGDEFTITIERRGVERTLETTATAWPDAVPFYGCG